VGKKQQNWPNEKHSDALLGILLRLIMKQLAFNLTVLAIIRPKLEATGRQESDVGHGVGCGKLLCDLC